jgi:hypothetical protein
MASVRVEPDLAPAARVVSEESARTAGRRRFVCDCCGETFRGIPEGAGLFVWTRGDETRFEEPPLCEKCATQITVGALVKWSQEEDEE